MGDGSPKTFSVEDRRRLEEVREGRGRGEGMCGCAPWERGRWGEGVV